jgi:hypothetical protein
MGSRDASTFEELLARGKGGGADAAGARGAGFVRSSAPGTTAAQGAVRVALGGILWHAFGRPGQPGSSWWFVSGVEIQAGDQGRDDARWWPDLAGFRRRRGEALPSGHPLRARPDWACEILGPPPPAVGGAAPETAPAAESAAPAAAQLHHHRRVPHLWIADPTARTLDVFRWTPAAYEPLSRLGPGATARTAPFPDITLATDDIFPVAR